MKHLITTVFFMVHTALLWAADPNRPPIADQIDFEYTLSYEITPQKPQGFERLRRLWKKPPLLKTTVNLPQTIANRQTITDINTTPKATRIFTQNGQKYAEFKMPVPRERFTISIDVRGTVHRYDLTGVLENKKPFEKPETDPTPWLAHERMIEKDDPTIQRIAETIEGDTELDRVRNIFFYTSRNLTGDGSKHKGVGAVQTLKSGKGMCIDYADVFVALCRAKQIPARVTAGYRIPPPGYQTEKRKVSQHAWAEVYLKEYGWVPFEVTQPLQLNDRQLTYSFQHMWPYYLKMTDIRSDPVLNNGYYHSYTASTSHIKKYIHPILEIIEFTQPYHQIHTSEDRNKEIEYYQTLNKQKKEAALRQPEEQL